MTDRFYPKGKASAEGVWKTTCETANELRSYERSPFPPGCSVHLPGSRDKFGYSTPGPIASRLANPSLTLRDEVNIQRPREHHAMPRSQVADEMDTFYNHDVPEMQRSYHSPVATSTFSPGSFKKSATTKMRSSRSLPALVKPSQSISTFRKTFEKPALVEAMEDDHFSYFVPQGLAGEGEDKLYGTNMAKLSKHSRISFPFAGDGTGFRSQGNDNAWWPAGGNISSETSYRSQYGTKPKFFRHSPMEQEPDLS